MIFMYQNEPKIWNFEKNKKKDTYWFTNSITPRMNVAFNPKIDKEMIEVVAEEINKNIGKSGILTYNYTSLGFNSKSGAVYINDVGEAAVDYTRYVVLFAHTLIPEEQFLNMNVYKGAIYTKYLDDRTNTVCAMVSLKPEEKYSNFSIVFKDKYTDKITRLTVSIRLPDHNNSARLIYRSEEYKDATAIRRNANGKPIFNIESKVFTNIFGHEEISSLVFRPRRPSANILCDATQKDAVIEILNRNYKFKEFPTRFNVLAVDDNYEDTVKNMDRGIRYITLYTPDLKEDDFRKMDLVDDVRKQYSAERFDHISILDENGNIRHLC